MKPDTYCSKCYTNDETYPFGFCRECWIKAGKPKRMDGTSNALGWEDYDDN